MNRRSAKPKAKTTRSSAKKRGLIETEVPKEPRAFVITRGVRNTSVKRLKLDLRRVFLPNTAQNVKERKFNKTRDFLDVCGPLGISHVMAFFATESSLNLKLIKTPQGPTVSFKVDSYSLMSSVLNATGKGFDVKHGLGSSPLVVLTNFPKTKHHRLLVTMLQNLFPSINPHSMDIKNKRRVVLFHYDEGRDVIQFRHYRISIPVSGLNKAVKSLLYGKGVPDLGDVTSIHDYLSKSGYASESEGEEAAESRIEIAPKLLKQEGPTTRRVKLTEMGPRMDLVLHKIEQGQMEGLVLYNKFVEKSMEEIAETGRRREETAQLRITRRKEQERRVELKRKEREEKKQRAKKQVPREVVSDDDDAHYYEEQVGLEPDAHFGVQKKKKEEGSGRKKAKRQKT